MSIIAETAAAMTQPLLWCETGPQEEEEEGHVG